MEGFGLSSARLGNISHNVPQPSSFDHPVISPQRPLTAHERQVLAVSNQLLDSVFQRPDPLAQQFQQWVVRFKGWFQPSSPVTQSVAQTQTAHHSAHIQQQFAQWKNLNKQYAQLTPHFAAQFNQKLNALLDTDPAFGTSVVSMLKDHH